MKTIENIIKNFIVDDVFSEHPGNIGEAFDYFMEADVDTTESVSLSELAFNYEVCAKYETENIRSIRDLMQSKLDDLVKLQGNILKDSSIFMVYQYDQWFSADSRVLFGVFTNKTLDEVKKIAMDGFEKLYPGFKDDIYSNGKNQWLSDKFDFGVCIEEVENINVFEEM